MTLLADAIFQQKGFVKDASGNYVLPPEDLAAVAAAPVVAPAPTAAPVQTSAPVAKPVTPVKATQPVDIPEPPLIGRPATTEVATTKKKSLLGS